MQAEGNTALPSAGPVQMDRKRFNPTWHASICNKPVYLSGILNSLTIWSGFEVCTSLTFLRLCRLVGDESKTARTVSENISCA